MLSHRENGKIAAFALAHADQLEKLVAKPMASFATAFIKVYFKAKSTSLGELRALGSEIGVATLLQAADKLTAAEALSVVKRIDPTSGSQAAEDPSWMRSHLAKLLSGAAEPVPVVKTPRAPKKSSPRKKRSVMGETDAFDAKRPSRVVGG